MKPVIVRRLILVVAAAATFAAAALSAPPRSVSADIHATAFVTDPIGITGPESAVAPAATEASYGLRLPRNVAVLVIRRGGQTVTEYTYYPGVDAVRLETGFVRSGDTVTIIPTDQ